MQVEIWSDVVCPWCAIGKARFETALDGLPYRDEVEVRWRSFELDPSAPAVPEGGNAERLAAKSGMSVDEARTSMDHLIATARAEGLELDLHGARTGNTFDAHRLLHLAADAGRQQEVKDRFLRGYHAEGAAIGEHATLRRLAVEAGLEEDDVDDVLGSDRYADAVRADEQQAFDFGCSGVPFFVFDRRFAVSGAQSPDVFRQTLDRAREEAAATSA